jgi:hypothetical protein
MSALGGFGRRSSALRAGEEVGRVDGIGFLRVLLLMKFEEHTVDSQQSRVDKYAYRPFRRIDVDLERA